MMTFRCGVENVWQGIRRFKALVVQWRCSFCVNFVLRLVLGRSGFEDGGSQGVCAVAGSGKGCAVAVWNRVLRVADGCEVIAIGESLAVFVDCECFFAVGVPAPSRCTKHPQELQEEVKERLMHHHRKAKLCPGMMVSLAHHLKRQ